MTHVRSVSRMTASRSGSRMSSSKDGRPSLCASISSSRSFAWMSSFCASRSRIFAVLFEVVSVAAKRKRLRMDSLSHA